MLEDQRLRPGGGLWWLSLITCGGASGWIVAHRVQMTEMPQLVARSTALSGLRRSSSGSTPISKWLGRGPPRHGRRNCHRVERYCEPGGAGRPNYPNRGDAGPGMLEAKRVFVSKWGPGIRGSRTGSSMMKTRGCSMAMPRGPWIVCP